MNKTFNNIKDCSFVSPTEILYLPYKNISTFFFLLLNVWNKKLSIVARNLL